MQTPIACLKEQARHSSEKSEKKNLSEQLVTQTRFKMGAFLTQVQSASGTPNCLVRDSID
jgi:hypothetical protein